MKKLISLFGIMIISIIMMIGCSRAENLKLCRIEIVDKNQNIVAVLENQSQLDVSVLFDESDMKKTKQKIYEISKLYCDGKNNSK